MNMKIFLLTFLSAFGMSVFAADEYAQIDSSGTVTWVIIANQKAINLRKDGPWVKTKTKIGIGYRYNGIIFMDPFISTDTIQTSTYTIMRSTPDTIQTSTYTIMRSTP